MNDTQLWTLLCAVGCWGAIVLTVGVAVAYIRFGGRGKIG